MKNIISKLNESVETTKNKYKFVKTGYTLTEKDERIINIIKNGKINFIPLYNSKNKKYSGWKYTIVGDTVDDAVYLYEQIGIYLERIGCSYKIATIKQITSGNAEQSVKLITIYIYDNTNVDYLLDDLKYYLKNYKPKATLKKSEHVWGPIYKRVDTDEYGNYIPA